MCSIALYSYRYGLLFGRICYFFPTIGEPLFFKNKNNSISLESPKKTILHLSLVLLESEHKYTKSKQKGRRILASKQQIVSFSLVFFFFF